MKMKRNVIGFSMAIFSIGAASCRSHSAGTIDSALKSESPSGSPNRLVFTQRLADQEGSLTQVILDKDANERYSASLHVANTDASTGRFVDDTKVLASGLTCEFAEVISCSRDKRPVDGDLIVLSLVQDKVTKLYSAELKSAYWDQFNGVEVTNSKQIAEGLVLESEAINSTSDVQERSSKIACNLWGDMCSIETLKSNCSISPQSKQWTCDVTSQSNFSLEMKLEFDNNLRLIGATNNPVGDAGVASTVAEAQERAASLACMIWDGGCTPDDISVSCKKVEMSDTLDVFNCEVDGSEGSTQAQMFLQFIQNLQFWQLEVRNP